MTSENFCDIWNKHEDFEIPDPQAPQLCKYAAEFATWVEEKLVAGLMGDGEVEVEVAVVRVNQAMLQLFKKYCKWYTTVPKSHRERIGDRGHVCIFHVMMANYERLRATELALAPPPLFLRQRPPQPPPVQMPALFLGEFDEE